MILFYHYLLFSTIGITATREEMMLQLPSLTAGYSSRRDVLNVMYSSKVSLSPNYFRVLILMEIEIHRPDNFYPLQGGCIRERRSWERDQTTVR